MSNKLSGDRDYSTETTPVSEKTFECFVCKKAGVPGYMIRLKGKDSQGYPVRIELDRKTPHRHKKKGDTVVLPQDYGGQQQQQYTMPQTESPTATDLSDIRTMIGQLKTNMNALINNSNTMNHKLDTIITSLKGDPTDDDGDSRREDSDRSDYDE